MPKNKKSDFEMSQMKECEEGRCPLCGKKFEEYIKHDIDGQSLAYAVQCPCGFEGWEIHSLEFSHYSYEDGKPVMEGDEHGKGSKQASEES